MCKNAKNCYVSQFFLALVHRSTAEAVAATTAVYAKSNV